MFGMTFEASAHRPCPRRYGTMFWRLWLSRHGVCTSLRVWQGTSPPRNNEFLSPFFRVQRTGATVTQTKEKKGEEQ